MKKAPAHRPMEPLERAACLMLAAIRYPVASFHKRFARDMAARAKAEAPTITEKQAMLVWRTLNRYRRQVRGHEGTAVLARALDEIARAKAAPPATTGRPGPAGKAANEPKAVPDRHTGSLFGMTHHPT